MAEKKSIKMHADTLRNIVIFLVVLAAALFFLVYPRHNSIKVLDSRVAKLEMRVEEHQTLKPIYTKLKTELDKKSIGNLPLPEKEMIPRKEIERISSAFKQIASKTGMRDIGIAPDVGSLGEKKGRMLVSAQCKGSFEDFQAFLRETGGLPFLEEVELVRIYQTPGDREFKVKFWVFLES